MSSARRSLAGSVPSKTRFSFLRSSSGPKFFSTISCSRAPTFFAAQPRCVSRICPTFMRDGTPSGFRTMSTGVPSSRYGMSSSGSTRETTPLLPWRPAILSPTASLRLMATYTFTILMTPGGSSSPFFRRPIFSPKRSFTGSFCSSKFSTIFRTRSCTSPDDGDLAPVALRDGVEQGVVGDVALLEELVALVVDEAAGDLLADEEPADLLERVSWMIRISSFWSLRSFASSSPRSPWRARPSGRPCG